MGMGMVGIRGGDVVVVAPASSFHHQIHHDHHQIHHDPISNSNTALGVGVIPLLTTAPCLPNMGIEDAENNRIRNTGGGAGDGGIQFWQSTQQSYLKKPTSMFDHTTTSMNFLTGGVGGTGGGVVVQTAATTCQDCGNQAKKDCTHRRCRTCCKSRGFDCATHVKSTWVSAARRRERQLCTTTTAAGSSGSSSAVKKPKLSHTTNSHTSTSNTTPRSFDTSSSHQGASFKEALPRQVRAPAVFKCVRVTAIDDGEDEYAYQAVVKIGGHVFKGFLYDQGMEGREGFPNISDLHLGGSGNAGANGKNVTSSSSPIIDPSDVYAASGGGLLGGSAAPPYGNPIN